MFLLFVCWLVVLFAWPFVFVVVESQPVLDSIGHDSRECKVMMYYFNFIFDRKLILYLQKYSGTYV
jgi:hypothetical protein